jgi:hypothetical protein
MNFPMFSLHGYVNGFATFHSIRMRIFDQILIVKGVIRVMLSSTVTSLRSFKTLSIGCDVRPIAAVALMLASLAYWLPVKYSNSFKRAIPLYMYTYEVLLARKSLRASLRLPVVFSFSYLLTLFN